MKNEIKIAFKNVFFGMFANRRRQTGKHSQQFVLYFFNNVIFENVLLRYQKYVEKLLPESNPL